MIGKICLLSCHNQYASKRYFTQKFAEALMRKGIATHILSWPHGRFPEELIRKIEDIQPDLTASFHQLPPQEDGRYFWDRLKRPHWTILLDPVFYDLELMGSPFSIISCVDRADCELLAAYHFQKTFFFPHAAERGVDTLLEQQRPLDVLMLGTCYDPDNLYAYWKKTYTTELVQVLEDAVERVLSDEKTNFVRALLQALTMHGIDPTDVEFDRLANYVDSYSRGIDRVNLIRSIRDAPVHVYGSKCWREELPIADWSHYLSRQANVTVHPAINYAESLQLMGKSKICLNSMPFFKNGTHERVFAALSCGSVPLSSGNAYLREVFADGQILFYAPADLSEVNDTVQSLLKDEPRRLQMSAAGKALVEAKHTWDNRADLCLQELEKLS